MCRCVRRQSVGKVRSPFHKDTAYTHSLWIYSSSAYIHRVSCQPCLQPVKTTDVSKTWCNQVKSFVVQSSSAKTTSSKKRKKNHAIWRRGPIYINVIWDEWSRTTQKRLEKQNERRDEKETRKAWKMTNTVKAAMKAMMKEEVEGERRRKRRGEMCVEVGTEKWGRKGRSEMNGGIGDGTRSKIHFA